MEICMTTVIVADKARSQKWELKTLDFPCKVKMTRDFSISSAIKCQASEAILYKVLF